VPTPKEFVVAVRLTITAPNPNATTALAAMGGKFETIKGRRGMWQRFLGSSTQGTTKVAYGGRIGPR